MLNVKHQNTNAQCKMLNVKHQNTNAQCKMQNVKHQMTNENEKYRSTIPQQTTHNEQNAKRQKLKPPRSPSASGLKQCKIVFLNKNSLKCFQVIFIRQFLRQINQHVNKTMRLISTTQQRTWYYSRRSSNNTAVIHIPIQVPTRTTYDESPCRKLAQNRNPRMYW